MNVNIAVALRGKALTSSEIVKVRHCIAASKSSDSRTTGKLIKLGQIL